MEEPEESTAEKSPVFPHSCSMSKPTAASEAIFKVRPTHEAMMVKVVLRHQIRHAFYISGGESQILMASWLSEIPNKYTVCGKRCHFCFVSPRLVGRF